MACRPRVVAAGRPTSVLNQPHQPWGEMDVPAQSEHIQKSWSIFKGVHTAIWYSIVHAVQS
jgi:hypothetical protein